MNKLYRVEVVCEVAVVAETQEEAEALVRDETVDWHDELGNASYDATEVTSMKQLDYGWRGAFPYMKQSEFQDKPCEFYVEFLDLANGMKE